MLAGDRVSGTDADRHDDISHNVSSGFNAEALNVAVTARDLDMAGEETQASDARHRQEPRPARPRARGRG